MDDGAALLRAICENPDEDTPRLMYADYLDAVDLPAITCPQCDGKRTVGMINGRKLKRRLACPTCGHAPRSKGDGTVLDLGPRMRAEFIRKQIAWARLGPNPTSEEAVALATRCHALLEDWDVAFAAPLGEVGFQANSTWLPECEWEYDRGFVDFIATDTRHLLNTPAITEAFNRHPIKAVKLSDKEPRRDAPSRNGVFAHYAFTYDFYDTEPGENRSCLPAPLFEEIKLLVPNRVLDKGFAVGVFESAKPVEAFTALWTAAANLHRARIGLTRLPLRSVRTERLPK